LGTDALPRENFYQQREVHVAHDDQHAVSRRRFVQATAASSLALAGTGFAGIAQAAKPNIVFILADDLGYADVSCYGQRDYATPHIDRLAAEGLKFTQAYSNSPDCSATRTSFALLHLEIFCRLLAAV
jgi:hypothetical protein